MTFPKLSGFIHFSKTFPGLENAVLKFHDFSRFFMTVRTLESLAGRARATQRERGRERERERERKSLAGRARATQRER